MMPHRLRVSFGVPRAPNLRGLCEGVPELGSALSTGVRVYIPLPGAFVNLYGIIQDLGFRVLQCNLVQGRAELLATVATRLARLLCKP